MKERYIYFSKGGKMKNKEKAIQSFFQDVAKHLTKTIRKEKFGNARRINNIHKPQHTMAQAG